MRKIRCLIGLHRQLDVIQSFGAVEHIGCPDCGKQFGIHHGLRGVAPWTADAADMYRRFGYDVDGPLAIWNAHREPRP